jgi:hypothetical protein
MNGSVERMKPQQSGEHDAFKHRESLFQRWRAELMRESGNRGSLDAAESRAMHDHEVREDPQLVAMIRAFAAECRAQLARPTTDMGARATTSAASSPAGHRSDSASADQALSHEALKRLEHEFLYQIAHFNEHEARLALDRMTAAQRAANEDHLQRMVLRRGRYEKAIDLLAARARQATRDGASDEAAHCLRKLSSIHAAHPQILSKERFDGIREDIVGASEEFDNRQAARHLVEKERAVAMEIQHLASTVHRFHKIARAIPHDAEAYRKALAAYQKAVREVKSHDSDWMAFLIVELADQLAEWDEPPAGAQKQIDHFLKSVRKALEHILAEVKEIEEEGAGS